MEKLKHKSEEQREAFEKAMKDAATKWFYPATTTAYAYVTTTTSTGWTTYYDDTTGTR